MSHIVVPKDPNDTTGRFAYALWHALSPIGGKFDKKRGVWVVPDTPAVRKALGNFKDLTRVPDNGGLRKNPATDIIVVYTSVDGYEKEKTFRVLEDAQAFAQKYVGTHPEIGSSYAISGDGVGKIEVYGAALADLFPDVRRTYKNPTACQRPRGHRRRKLSVRGLPADEAASRDTFKFQEKLVERGLTPEEAVMYATEYPMGDWDEILLWVESHDLRRRNPAAPVFAGPRQLRKRGLLDGDKYTIMLPVVKSGTMAQLNAWAKKQGLTWQPEKQWLFGGYWVVPGTGTTYEIT